MAGSVAIHWFRRDLRIADNTALNAALAGHDQVVPVYILSEWKAQHHWCGAPWQKFLCGCLESLARNLEAKGGRLIIRQGRADEVLEKLILETGATALHFNRDPDPFGRQMEKAIEKMAVKWMVAVHAHQDIALHERDEILTASGTPFKVFTPFARAWHQRSKPEPGRTLSRIVVPEQVSSDELPALNAWGLECAAEIVSPGERAARRRLERFLDGPIFYYSINRDFPARSDTSRLSQDLRWGTLSIREVYARCMAAAKGATVKRRHSIEVFINELIWREFYFQVLWFRPDVLEHEFQDEYRDLDWREHWRPGARPDGPEIERWRDGQTGFPIVDAGMRQLLATGFMHNRVRMITAMFLTKDLHIWWMHGESHFMRHLVDGEIASNNGGWQWSASTGTDAAPYFRIQNPWSQSRRFDPEGAYIRQWVPELRDVDPAKLKTPPSDGSPIAKGYPAPMIDHAREREAALEMFKGERKK
ncbi:MAG: deoxyribodipyrimidine photo-lyase [Chthoniobacteraceae bacterium]